MKYALLLMGNVTDADCGEDGGPDPAEFMAFDKEITDAGIVVGGFALDGPRTRGAGQRLRRHLRAVRRIRRIRRRQLRHRGSRRSTTRSPGRSGAPDRAPGTSRSGRSPTTDGHRRDGRRPGAHRHRARGPRAAARRSRDEVPRPRPRRGGSGRCHGPCRRVLAGPRRPTASTGVADDDGEEPRDRPHPAPMRPAHAALPASGSRTRPSRGTTRTTPTASARP
ncbi:Uncharacterised protein [Brevibacterium casei]|uniref:Uncharacterized protein n=1 Tax=Brevibacterium casei TaxID=33889 RepID=A0A449CZA2_9MICO|nr:Uncharacterised protein [Brevibacterium casei]